MAPSYVRMESAGCCGGMRGACGGWAQCACSMGMEGEVAAESGGSGRSQSALRAWGHLPRGSRLPRGGPTAHRAPGSV